MKYRVTLNGTVLSKNPLGLDNFNTEFIRDNEIFGIYSVSSFDLIFLGDGYCILRDLQSDLSTCDITIVIEQFCSNSWTTIFEGIIEVGSIEIDEELSQATCELQDNSPIALISRNADVTIDIETDKDLFGGSVTPAVFASYSLDSPTASGVYTSYLTNWDEAMKAILEAITGKTVNISSTFMATVPLDCIYTLQYTGTLADLLTTTIVFKDFQGITQTILADFNTGVSNISEVAKRLLSSTSYVATTNAKISNVLQYEDDYRNFYKTTFDVPTKTVVAYSNLPIEIISATATSVGAPITINISKTQEYTDGGGNPLIGNYRSVKNQTGQYNCVMSFKELMTILNNEYNVFFLATYEPDGSITVRVEDYQTIADSPINYTFNNAKNLKVTFDEETAAKEVKLGDNNNETIANKAYTFTSELCGLGQQLDTKTSAIIGTADIYSALETVYEETDTNRIFLFGNLAVTDVVEWTNDNYVSLTKYEGNVYNIYLTNWHKVYRHLNRFRGNVIGNAPFFDNDVFDYSINITNDALNRLFRKYEFEENMTRAQFDSLIDNVFDKAQFKRASETTYRQGLIKAIQYNQNTGKALITLLGE